LSGPDDVRRNFIQNSVDISHFQTLLNHITLFLYANYPSPNRIGSLTMTASIPPIISIVGKSGCGKTTLLEALIPILTARGYRIATVKHHGHSGADIDQPGKDTWRHYEAGADVVVIAATDKMAIMERLEDEISLEQIASRIVTVTQVDLILTEGYRRGPAPKIEVVRAARSDEALCTPEELLALVSDVPPEKLPPGPPVCALDAVQDVADLVECRLIRHRTLQAKTRKNAEPADALGSEIA
jgi:molybdopterin-guanine dinucleotide biosynthesis protein B